jgi:hypothetical protein
VGGCCRTVARWALTAGGDSLRVSAERDTAVYGLVEVGAERLRLGRLGRHGPVIETFRRARE